MGPGCVGQGCRTCRGCPCQTPAGECWAGRAQGTGGVPLAQDQGRRSRASEPQLRGLSASLGSMHPSAGLPDGDQH